MDNLQVIRQEAAGLRDAVAGADLGQPVPSCPAWSLRELVAHVGTTHRFHTTHVQRGVTDPPSSVVKPVAPEDDAQLLAWFDEGVEEMLAVFGAQDPQGPAWNWSLDEQVASFWPRRMALETAVHRWDAENTVRRATGFDTAVAIDGIDEVLRVHLPADRSDDEEEEEPAPELTQGRVRVSATDDPADWLVELTPFGANVTGGADGHTEQDADAAVRGPVSDLFLMLWGRLDIDLLDVTGDPDLVAAVRTT